MNPSLPSPSHRPSGPDSRQVQAQATAWKRAVEGALAQDTASVIARRIPSLRSHDARVAQLRTLLRASLQEQVRAMAARLPREASPAHVQAFESRAQSQVEGIVRGAFLGLEGAGRRDTAALHQAIVSASEIGQAFLIESQRTLVEIASSQEGRAAVMPEVRATLDEDGQVHVMVMRKAPQVEDLVLRGGGAKGAVYGPVLSELEGSGMMAGVQRLAGASAGALTAACLASGMDATTLDALSSSLDMHGLKARPADFDRLYPSVEIDLADRRQVMGAGHGGEALRRLDVETAGSVSRYLDTQWKSKSPAFEAGLGRVRAKYGQAACDRLAALRTPDFNAPRTDRMLTFRDLVLLREIDPGRFKELVLTGWDRDRQKTFYFSAEATPGLPVALAARVSMALPGLFLGVRLDPDGTGVRTFVDGGLGSNLPAEVALGGKGRRELPEALPRTALLAFDEQGKIHGLLHKGQDPRPRLVNHLVGRFVGNPRFASASAADYRKVQSAGLSTLVAHHGTLGTLDVAASSQRIAHARSQARLLTLEQLANRQGQAYEVEHFDPKVCYASLGLGEKVAVLKAGRPRPPEVAPMPLAGELDGFSVAEADDYRARLRAFNQQALAAHEFRLALYDATRTDPGVQRAAAADPASPAGRRDPADLFSPRTDARQRMAGWGRDDKSSASSPSLFDDPDPWGSPDPDAAPGGVPGSSPHWPGEPSR